LIVDLICERKKRQIISNILRIIRSKQYWSLPHRSISDAI
jgi:hypothetical protein